MIYKTGKTEAGTGDLGVCGTAEGKAMPLTLYGQTRWDMSCWIFPEL